MNGTAEPLTETLDTACGVMAELAGSSVGDLLTDLDPASAETALLSFITLGRQVAGVTAQLVRRVDVGGSWAEQGHRSVSAWLGARSTLSRRQAQDLCRAGDWAEQHPVMSAAVSRGSVDHAHVKVVADAHRHYPRLSPALHRIEADLADYAATTDPDTFARLLGDRLHRIDPDAVDDADAERFRRDAFLTANTLPDGYVRVHGVLPPEIGTALRAALDAAARTPEAAPDPDPDPEAAPAAGAGAEPGLLPDARLWDPTPGGTAPGGTAPGGRVSTDPATTDATTGTVMPPGTGPQAGQPTRRQRNVTSLGRVLAAAAAAAGDTRLPDVRGARPVVHLQVHPDTVADWLARARHAIGHTDTRHDDTCSGTGHGCDGPGARLLGSPALLTSTAAQRICCDAEIRRILIDPDGAVLDVGRQTRIISPALRIAITTRDRHCRFPGCRAPIDDIHHIQHWIDGGTTDRANLLGLCWFHHHEIHHSPWTLTGHADHEIQFTRTSILSGLTWTSRPARR